MAGYITEFIKSLQKVIFEIVEKSACKRRTVEIALSVKEYKNVLWGYKWRRMIHDEGACISCHSNLYQIKYI